MAEKIFEIKTKSTKSKARKGVLTLSHGEIQTPVFMGIGTVGSVKGLTTQDLLRLDAEIILGNTYHLWLRPGMEVIQSAKISNDIAIEDKHFLADRNLHQFINWPKPILTDSGGFQAFSLSKIRKFTDEGVFFQSQIDGQKRFLSPEISMAIQSLLGSDIALVLDECLPAEITKKTAIKAMKRTHTWAERSKLEFERIKREGVTGEALLLLEKDQMSYTIKKIRLEKDRFRSQRGKIAFAEFVSQNEFPSNKELKFSIINDYPRHLFGIPQGAQFKDLRKESALLTMELDFPGYSIGGVANGGEPEQIMYNQVLAQTEVLEDHKPRHLLGVGTPKDIIEMVKRGIDMFDCVYPTRNARHGSIFVWTDIDKLEYENIKIKSSKYKKDFSAINSHSKLEELKQYSKAYLNHLFRSGELLAYRLATLNNLEFYYTLMRKIREKIEQDEI